VLFRVGRGLAIGQPPIQRVLLNVEMINIFRTSFLIETNKKSGKAEEDIFNSTEWIQ
jgi:hypothetical protein